MAKGTRTIMVAALAASSLASGAAEAAETTNIVLHLTNHAGIEPAPLALARTRAETVFSDIGIRLMWQEGPGKADDQCCTSLRLSVTLLSTDRGPTEEPGGHTLGIADKIGGTAFIYPVRIGALAERTRRLTGDLLGLVIAHEVGHLLLAPGHSQGGIMARSVETDPTRTFALFSSGQARTIRALLARKAKDCEERISSQP